MQHPLDPVPTEKAVDHSGLLLIPVLPSLLPRYDRPIHPWNGALTEILPAITRLSVRSGLISEAWRQRVSPEGDCYFHHEQHRIVTNTNVRIPSAEQKLLKAYALLVELGRAQDPHIVNREVYIHIVTETPAASQVEYYFVDADARHPFWVHSVRMRDLGLPGFETLDHLKAALTPEFWTHREYFPEHQALDKSSEKELIAIFRHGCADDMTSFGSTFPYSAQECREHLQTLEGFAGSDDPSGYRTATFARLWASITRVRHINGYSLPSPRLDRNQGLTEFKKSQRPNYVLRVLDILFLTLPRAKFDRITELWNGRVVFQRHWHNYFDEQRGEWLRLAILSAAIFIVGIFIIVIDGPDPLAVASASMASASVMSALTLHGTHSRSRFNTASDISNWIMGVESFRSGLLPLAVKFTVPHATAIYSGFFLLVSLLKLIAKRVGNDTSFSTLSMAALAPSTVILLTTSFL